MVQLPSAQRQRDSRSAAPNCAPKAPHLTLCEKPHMRPPRSAGEPHRWYLHIGVTEPM
jgi:hypothetical protein